MARKVNRHKGKTTLSVCLPEVSRTGVLGEGLMGSAKVELTELRMIRSVEIIGGRFLEALLAMPGHVLNGDKASFCEQEEVKITVGKNDIVGGFYDMG